MNAWERIDLGGGWIMTYLDNAELTENPREIRRYSDVASAVPALTAAVPGNFELDLMNAGVIGDLYYADNILQAQKFESAHVWYARKFTYSATPGADPLLVFEGLDTVAEIFLNGELIARADNMLVIHSIPLENLAEGENELVVHIVPACIAARENGVSAGNMALKYNYETLRLRKSPAMFGWDIAPRLVSCGIFRPVYIARRPKEYFRQCYLTTDSVDLDNRTAAMRLFYDFNLTGSDLADYEIRVRGECDGHKFSAQSRLWFTGGKLTFRVEDAQFWSPKGYGRPCLYDVGAELLRDGQTIDVFQFKCGIRTVRLLRTDTTDAFFSGDFHFEINGRPIFILGTNFVPIDALHARDRERLPKVAALLDEIGCNAVRMWGGGVYEDDYLFDYCDEHGILIWQDFIMACGVYPIDGAFRRVVDEEAVSVVRRLRNHASLMLWSGDNECDQMAKGEPHGGDPNRNRITRQVLPDVVAFEDPARPYLPSSPYISPAADKLPEAYLPENHLWGPRDYFKGGFYTGSYCHFASEIGYHGCPSVESMRKFLSPERLWPWRDNPEWLVHAASPETSADGIYAYRIELMVNQIRELFGSAPDVLEDFVAASQISQAEAKKFFIELFRLEKEKRSGIIWWNLIDCWPQFSDAVVDYYFDKKLAFDYIKRSQKPLLLAFSEPADWKLRLRAVNDSGQTLTLRYTVRDYFDDNRAVLSGEAEVGREVRALGEVPYCGGEKKIYAIEWDCGEYSGKNHYLAGRPPFDLAAYRRFAADQYGFVAH